MREIKASLIQVRVTRFKGDAGQQIKKIRSRVFSREQHVDPAIDFDGLDQDAVHVLVQLNGDFVGTGRLLHDGHMGRIAVLKPARGMGLGKQIVSALVHEAEKHGMDRVFLGAQDHAVAFYEKLGFEAFGPFYEEAGIMHVKMEKFLHPGEIHGRTG